MSTIERIEQLIEMAQQLGYRIRHDYFGGTGGGKCEFGGQKWIFIDLALTSVEQLDQLHEALANEPLLPTLAGSPEDEKAKRSVLSKPDKGIIFLSSQPGHEYARTQRHRRPESL